MEPQVREVSCPSKLSANVRSKLPQSPLTYLLFCVFGLGSWVAVNGLWAEIAILTRTLPECNCLPALLVVVIQVANAGPLLYTLVKWLYLRKGFSLYRLEVCSVLLLVCVGVVASVFLAVFWDQTAMIGGVSHSVGLVVISLFLALVDCTSSVVFLPFMQHFPSQYISALYIGEGMSGVLPSVVALSQGFVNNSLPTCLGRYNSYIELGINFSPNVFFVFLAVMMLACGVAFGLIVCLPQVKRLMIKPTAINTDVSQEQQERLLVTTSQRSKLNTVGRVLWKHLTLYVCIAGVNFLTNGGISAISAFALFPYGSEVYHVAINLGLLASPLSSLLYVLLPHKSPVYTAVLCCIAALLGVYILEAAVLDPPPLHTQVIGKIIIVCVYVSIYGLVTYSKLGAMVQLHANTEHRDTALFLGGLITQLGSFIGAALFFVLVYFTNIFPGCDQ